MREKNVGLVRCSPLTLNVFWMTSLIASFTYRIYIYMFMLGGIRAGPCPTTTVTVRLYLLISVHVVLRKQVAATRRLVHVDKSLQQKIACGNMATE